MKKSVNHFETEIEEINYIDGSKVSERREHTKADGFSAILCALRKSSVLGTLLGFIKSIVKVLPKHNYLFSCVLIVAVYMV